MSDFKNHRTLTISLSAMLHTDAAGANTFMDRVLMDFKLRVLRDLELERHNGQPITTDPVLDPL